MTEELSPAGRFGLHHICSSTCSRQAVSVDVNRSGQADRALCKAHLETDIIAVFVAVSVGVVWCWRRPKLAGGGNAGSGGFQKEKENRTQSMVDRRRRRGSAARKRLDLAVRRQKEWEHKGSFALLRTHTLSRGCWGDLTNRLDSGCGYETDRGACAGVGPGLSQAGGATPEGESGG